MHIIIDNESEQIDLKTESMFVNLKYQTALHAFGVNHVCLLITLAKLCSLQCIAVP